MNWKEIVLTPIQQVLARIGNFLPTLVGILIILLVGLLVAKAIQKLVIKALQLLQLDSIADKIGVDTILSKGDIKYTLSELVGILVYWLLILIVVMIAINALGLTITAILLNQVIAYIPNVIVAVFIIVFGLFFATLLASLVYTAASNAGIGQAKFLSRLAQTVVVMFAVIMALEQLGVAIEIVKFTLQAVIGAIALGGAIAFGLGCKDMAAKAMQTLTEKLKKK